MVVSNYEILDKLGEDRGEIAVHATPSWIWYVEQAGPVTSVALRAHRFDCFCRSVVFFATILGLLFDLLTASVASAQVFGEAARTEFLGGLGVRTFYGRINKTDVFRDGDRISDPDPIPIPKNIGLF